MIKPENNRNTALKCDLFPPIKKQLHKKLFIFLCNISWFFSISLFMKDVERKKKSPESSPLACLWKMILCGRDIFGDIMFAKVHLWTEIQYLPYGDENQAILIFHWPSGPKTKKKKTHSCYGDRILWQAAPCVDRSVIYVHTVGLIKSSSTFLNRCL